MLVAFGWGMGSLARLRLRLAAALATGVLPVLVAAAASANEITAAVVPTSGGIVVHDAAETLRDWCRADDQGLLWLELPGGVRYELITSIDDPAIANRGDGSFHPFEATEVAAALAAVSYPLDGIAAAGAILP